jgi:hypothetical protein
MQTNNKYKMINNFIYIIIVISIILFSLKSYCEFNSIINEQFASDLLYEQNFSKNNRSGLINATPYISIAENITLNKYNQIENISIRPPIPKNSDNNCILVTCPNYIPSSAICWKCE